MNNFWKKFEKTLGIAGSIISVAGLGYNLWKTFSRKDLIPNQIYSVAEAAKIFGISQEETMQLIYNGKLSAQ